MHAADPASLVVFSSPADPNATFPSPPGNMRGAADWSLIGSKFEYGSLLKRTATTTLLSAVFGR